jgi:hypothetical protein
MAYSSLLWGLGLVLLLTSAAINHFLYGRLNVGPESNVLQALSEYSVLGITKMDLLQYPFWNHLMQFLLLFGAGLVLQYISSEFRLIRVRSFFPFFLYCLFSGTFLPLLSLNGTALSSLLLALACHRLFSSLENGMENRSVYDASVLLALASLLLSKLIWLMPAIWLVMGILQILNIRSFFASLLGILTVYWLIAGVSFLMGDFTYVLAYFKDLMGFELFSISAISPTEITYITFLAVLMIAAIISFWPRQHLDKLKTRNYLNSVLLLWLALLILWFFSSNDESYLLPLIGLSTLVIAHFFSLVDSHFSRILFFTLLGLSVVAYLSF